MFSKGSKYSLQQIPRPLQKEFGKFLIESGTLFAFLEKLKIGMQKINNS